MNEPELLQKHLRKHIVNLYKPGSTRWHRNYTDRADWFGFGEKEMKINEKEYDSTMEVTKVIDSYNFQVSYPLLCKKWWEFWK